MLTQELPQTVLSAPRQRGCPFTQVAFSGTLAQVPQRPPRQLIPSGQSASSLHWLPSAEHRMIWQSGARSDVLQRDPARAVQSVFASHAVADRQLCGGGLGGGVGPCAPLPLPPAREAEHAEQRAKAKRRKRTMNGGFPHPNARVKQAAFRLNPRAIGPPERRVQRPVLPKPPLPRTVFSSSAAVTSSVATCGAGAITS